VKYTHFSVFTYQDIISVWFRAFKYALIHCQGGKTSVMILKKKSLLTSIWEGYKAISRQFEVHHSTAKKIINKVENIQDSCQSFQEWMSRQIHP